MSEKKLIDSRNRRVLAMQILYQAELLEKPPETFADNTFEMVFNNRPRNKKFENRVLAIVSGVIKNMSEIDQAIEKHLQNWTLARLASVDRNLLRVSICETAYISDDPVPARVSINEAVEIAKEYCSSDSPAFINALLDKIYGDLDLLNQ
jgi:N utilization substance protein B